MNENNDKSKLAFSERLGLLSSAQKSLVERVNTPAEISNGAYRRWDHPVMTRNHVPLHWRYDFDPVANPHLIERLGVNATFNSGAIFRDGKHLLVLRIEGNDRKSFFAVAESENGVDNFAFWNRPISMPETGDPDTNVYDIRLTAHQDGWIYGLFCTERKDFTQPHDITAAIAQCGIARTKDLRTWDRLPDLKTGGGQQRNVVLHPEFIDGRYGLYTRPQDGFITVGGGGGIGWGTCTDMTNAQIDDEFIVDTKVYHTIKEVKNGQGPPPIKTDIGWLHLAHGVRNTAAGLRYVLYMVVTDIDRPWIVIHQPGGHFLAPQGGERIGDVSNVVFCNGWTVNSNGDVFIYYASSDTRLHVATSSIELLIDYCVNTPEDPLTTATCVQQRISLIEHNSGFMAQL